MGEQKKDLRWVSREVASAHRARLKMLSRSMVPTVEAMGDDAAPATHELPDLSGFPTPREKAIRLLQTAAAVEHSLLVQYLYAGYSFSLPNRDILNIAIEEMSHLMTVQNLLKLIGAEPDLSRQDFGPPAGDEVRLFPFNLNLEPLTNVSLAKYVVAESPENATATVPAALMNCIITGGHTVCLVGGGLRFGTTTAATGGNRGCLGHRRQRAGGGSDNPVRRA